MNTVYNGTLYDIGTVIPNYVSSVYTPHVWYDQSKTYKSASNIFEELQISESLLLGDSEDDMWSIEDILEEILKYLNLHIIQDGYDYYIFDWETCRTDTQVVWLDIFTGETMTKQYSTINVPVSTYSNDDTQLSMSDVYNQVSVTDDITKFEDVIFSPFDDGQLQSLTQPQLYMIEYAAPGEGNDAFNTFYDMVRNNVVPDTDYGKGSDAYKKKWYMMLKKTNYWEFLTDGVDTLSYLRVDANGKFYDQWRVPYHLFTTPFSAGMLSFGSGDEYNKDNAQEIQNVSNYTDMICINIGGNGADEQSAAMHQRYPILSVPPTMFPNEDDIENCGLNIKYNYTTEGNYSPADDNITNYIVFSGTIHMTAVQQATGDNGFFITGMYDDYYNRFTNAANDTSQGGNYVDWCIVPRKTNAFSQYANWSSNKSTAREYNKYKCVPSSKNDDGAYYGMLFFDTAYPYTTEHANPSLINLMPPMDRGSMAKRFKYDFSKHSYLEANGIDYDIIGYVDILACQLQIGDKICEEYTTTETVDGIQMAYKHYRWRSTQELYDAGLYDVLPDGSIRYIGVYIYLSIDINNGDFIIGEDHDFYNNIETSMGLKNKKGIAIPIHASDALSGELKFNILGPVNNWWNNGIRRHKTWFKHTQTISNVVSILPHVAQIYIKKFNVELCSDNGKNIEFDDADIVYRSDEQKKYINKKENNFKLTTTLTAAEAAEMQVNYTVNKSDVIDSDGAAILDITDEHTNETDKPEKIYVDAYYREYCEPRTIMETSVHDGNIVNQFNKYNISFMPNKTYYFVSEEKNVAEGTTKLKLKEI